MKKLLTLVFLISAFLTFGQKRLIRCQVTQKHPYCGGARPTPDMEKDALIPKPYARKTFIYKIKSKVDSVTIDDNGFFTVTLKPGTYKFYEPWKFHKRTQDGSPIDHFDKKCLEAEWKKEDLLLVVSKKTEKFTNNIEQGKCEWQYPCYLKEYTPRMPE